MEDTNKRSCEKVSFSPCIKYCPHNTYIMCVLTVRGEDQAIGVDTGCADIQFHHELQLPGVQATVHTPLSQYQDLGWFPRQLARNANGDHMISEVHSPISLQVCVCVCACLCVCVCVWGGGGGGGGQQQWSSWIRMGSDLLVRTSCGLIEV